MSDDNGRYRFRTIMPGAYLARADIGRWRPKHIHLSIRGGSACLMTQMYFRGDKYLEGDPAFILLGDAQERHFANPVGEPTDDGVTHYNWDIVVGGRNACYFEEP